MDSFSCIRWLLGSAAAALLCAWLARRLSRRLLGRSGDGLDVRGRVALVSGATGGLGSCLARALSAAGARVVLCGRDKSKLLALRDELPGESWTVLLDLDESDESLESAIESAWREAGGVDLLVNNAGRSYRGRLLDTKPEVHSALMRANYFGHVTVTATLCRLAVANNRQLTVVGIGSLQGLVSQPYRSAYAASKHAFQAFHDSLRAELSDRGIRVLTVSPAYIRTGLSANAATASGARYDKLDESTAKGMSPESAADAVLDAVARGDAELLLGPWHLRAAPLLRRLAPGLMFYIMRKRANTVTC